MRQPFGHLSPRHALLAEIWWIEAFFLGAKYVPH